jgi:peptidoglycan-associated lipoprotein
MQLKKLVQAIVMSGVFLTLGACTAHHGAKTGDNTTVSDANGGAYSSGAGAGANFGEEGANGKTAAAKRTYYFDYDKSDIRDEYKPAILANADYLSGHSNAKIILEGHTDPRGSREYNVALGERRANAVAELLKTRGVNANQVRVVSYGAERLARAGRTESDYQLDRRAIIIYSQN